MCRRPRWDGVKGGMHHLLGYMQEEKQGPGGKDACMQPWTQGTDLMGHWHPGEAQPIVEQ